MILSVKIRFLWIQISQHSFMEYCWKATNHKLEETVIISLILPKQPKFYELINENIAKCMHCLGSYLAVWNAESNLLSSLNCNEVLSQELMNKKWLKLTEILFFCENLMKMHGVSWFFLIFLKSIFSRYLVKCTY